MNQTVKLILQLLTVLVMLQISVNAYQASICTTQTCTARRGSIHYTGYQTLGSSVRVIRSLTGRTTITILLKNIRHFRNGISYFQIHTFGNFMNTHNIVNSQMRVITLKDTEQVSINLMRWDPVQYELEYFMDCEVSKGKSVTVEVPAAPTARSTQSQSLWDQYWGVTKVTTPRCWIILPTMRNETARRTAWDMMFNNYYNFPTYYNTRRGLVAATEVFSTFVVLKDLRLEAGTQIDVTNVLTGANVMQDELNNTMSMTWVRKHNQFAGLDDGTVISTMILVDLLCPNDAACGQARFTMTTTAMGENDVACVRREQNCMFNIGTVTTPCANRTTLPSQLALAVATPEQLSNSVCPAYQEVLNQLTASVDSEPELTADNTDGRNWYRGCRPYTYYCSLRNCVGLYGFCHRFCFLLKKMGYCPGVQSRMFS